MDASDILSLLHSKNRCLERFLALTEEYLPRAEGGDFASLGDFQRLRDEVLKAVDLYDRKISAATAAFSSVTPADPATVEGVRAALDARESLVHRIILTDQKVIALIERERDRIRQALDETRRDTQHANKLKKFKSGWVPESGEELDKKL